MFNTLLVSFDHKWSIREVGTPLLYSINNSNQLSLIHKHSMLSRAQSFANISNRMVVLHEHNPNTTARSISFKSERFGEVWQGYRTGVELKADCKVLKAAVHLKESFLRRSVRGRTILPKSSIKRL